MPYPFTPLYGREYYAVCLNIPSEYISESEWNKYYIMTMDQQSMDFYNKGSFHIQSTCICMVTSDRQSAEDYIKRMEEKQNE